MGRTSDPFALPPRGYARWSEVSTRGVFRAGGREGVGGGGAAVQGHVEGPTTVLHLEEVDEAQGSPRRSGDEAERRGIGNVEGREGTVGGRGG